MMRHPITDEEDFDPSGIIQIGTVASVDLAAARCTVDIAGQETPPLRWIESRMGETRIWSPPSVGEQVILLCMDGELGAGLVLRGIPSTAFPPAGNSTEEVMLFADGARIAYDPEAHRLTALLPGGSTIDITADQVNITGNVAITGDLDVSGTATATEDVIGGGKSLKTHKHSAVQPGSGQSGPPA